MDWNSDGIMDLVSGDRSGFFNVFIRDTLGDMTAYYQYQFEGGGVIDVGANSQPAIWDWNNDGMKDLVIGAEASEVRVYLNVSSDTWPMFDDQYELVMANGAQIRFNRGNPYFFDLDRDGTEDLIMGENNGWVHFFRNIGTPEQPEFEAGETLKFEDGTSIRYAMGNYYGSRCGFGYWDGDDIPDFLLGTYEGHVALYSGLAPTGVKEERKLPLGEFTVSPVPGGPPVKLALNLNREARVEVCDGTGRVIRGLGTVQAGRTSLAWNGADDYGRRVPNGVYFCRVTSDEESRTGRLVLTR